jgi:hypothetical protein
MCWGDWYEKRKKRGNWSGEALEVRTSRWRQFLFPSKLVCDEAGVEASRKTWWMRGWRVYSGFTDIASIRMEEGVVFATITIETRGGDQLVVDGLWKQKAKAVYDAIRSQMTLPARST